MTHTAKVLVGLQALVLLCWSTTSAGAQPSCSAVHKACSACGVVATAAGVRQQFCQQCAPGYVVSNDQRTCDCAPGYYYSTSSNSAVCLLCSKGDWCTGGSAQAAGISSCGLHLTTVSTGAVSQASCITKPGVAYMRGVSTAVLCPVNTYNEGSNQRNCSSCPTGTGTAAPGASTIGACAALPGWFHQSQRAILPCPQGTYKTQLSSSVNCSRCPAGSTTRGIRATAVADCAVALPGYQALQGPSTPQAAHTVPCPVGTYSNGYTTDSCRPCPLGLTTPSTGSKSFADCSAPPGFGFYCPAGQLQGSGHVSTAMLQAQGGGSCMLLCPDGSFKSGWGRGPCVSCGISFRSVPGATSAQDCYIPAGWGYTAAGAWGDSKALVARKCLQGTYGASQPQYGTAKRHPCQRCPAHMVTPDMAPNVTSLKGQAAAAALEAITSEQQCLTMPGYGFTGGQAVRCEVGSYSPGYNRQPCLLCGTGMTTQRAGSAAVTDCIALQGWHLTGPGTASQCPKGTWGAGGTAPCIPCKNWNPKKPTICKISEPDVHVMTNSGDYFSSYDAAYLSDYAITDEDYTAGTL